MFRYKKIIVRPKNVYIEVAQHKRMKKKVCIVTGATGSIGHAIAARFAAEGATVALTGRNKAKLMELQKELQKYSDTVFYQIMDINDAESIASAMSVISKQYNTIDILVNNAGFSARTEKRPLHEQSINNIDGLLNTNLRGAILTSREIVQYMKTSEQGRIIHISSVVGIQGKDKHAEYAAAKAGLFGLMKSQAIELGQYGITVNCVSPGLVPREDASIEKLANFSRQNRLGEVCTPDDIANAVIFLASEEARFITGQNLTVDGGRSIGLYGD